MRQIDISGAIARSWYTVAMPAAFASRGERKWTSRPSIRKLPSSWRCTPARILMNVDLPAPLSPSTHVTSPAWTLVVMFLQGDACCRRTSTIRCSSSSGGTLEIACWPVPAGVVRHWCPLRRSRRPLPVRPRPSCCELPATLACDGRLAVRRPAPDRLVGERGDQQDHARGTGSTGCCPSRRAGCPCWVIPRMRQPSAAPTIEPKPPVSRQPPSTAAMMK